MKLLYTIGLLAVIICCHDAAYSQDTTAKVVSRLIGNERLGRKDSVANWTIHFQITAIWQYHPAFHSLNSGPSSLDSSSESALSLTTTLFLGRKLWKRASLYVNPEVSGGEGLSGTHGLAGFPNGEIYRVGNPTPTPFIARLFFQQVIPLKNTEYETLASDQNVLAGKSPTSKVVITVGKFGISDFFDANSYSHDARSQFMNWSLMAAGSWDFPADTRGYTSGFVVEVIKPLWQFRFSGVLEPRVANGLVMDYHINKANSETVEGVKTWGSKSLPGAIRADGFISFTKAPSYKAAVAQLQEGDTVLENIIDGQLEGAHYGGVKYGFGLNAEQALPADLGIFARANWDDGHTATWAFTEIDNSFSIGARLKGTKWKRPMDIFGLAGVVNGLSPDHLAYARAGGEGFIIGDNGLLRYGHESILETYYNAQLASFVWLTVDYQFCANPAYNRDRGPVNIIGLRVHLEI